MVFMKSIYLILRRSIREIFYHMYHSFLKIIAYIVLLVVIGLAATRCAKAMTINDNLRTIGDTQLNMFIDVFERSNYKNYVISSVYATGSYSSTNYYLCLTDSDINTGDYKNINVICDELYRYYSYSSNYTFEKVNDDHLNIKNSVYYTNNQNERLPTIYIFTILFILSTFFIFSILRVILW